MSSLMEVGDVMKTDGRGRVLVPVERREALLDEFERSGMSGAKNSPARRPRKLKTRVCGVMTELKYDACPLFPFFFAENHSPIGPKFTF